MAKNNKKQISRREFIGSAAALASIALVPSRLYGCKPAIDGSRFGGVQIGVITYSYRSMPSTAEDILGYLQESGLTSVELMGGPIEEFAGIPQIDVPRYPRGTELTDEQATELRDARERQALAQREWRTSVGMDKFRELRQMYNDAGVNIDIAKLGRPEWSDEEIDYAFNVARVLGARGITFEISMDAARRMAPFADRHNLYAIMHNHGQPAQPGFSFEDHLAFGRNLMLNFDVGHYYGYTGRHPNDVIEKLHDRIASLHLKDKTGPQNDPANANVMWGEGGTPLDDILFLLKDRGWPIVCDIELEYPVPENSNAVREVTRCVEYCKEILV